MPAGSPLTPPDCDLRDFEFMPLDVQRLFNSDFWLEATSDHKAAAIELWGRAWHQTPAGSVPAKEAILAALSGARDKWPDVRDLVMRGWVDGGDGRMYHPVVCEKALEAWLEKLAQRVSSGHGNAKRWNGHFDDTHLQEQLLVARPMLFALNPLSKAFSRKRTASVESGDKSKTPAPVPPIKTRKPYTRKPVDKQFENELSRPDNAGISSTSKGTVKGQGNINTGAVAPGDGVKPKITMADRNFKLPEWMPKEQWAAFEETRWAKHGRAPYTLRAQQGLIKKLQLLRDEGQDLVAVLESSVRNSYTDVYAQKGAAPNKVRSALSEAGRATFANGKGAEERLFGQEGGHAAQ
jgi:hypothetical protein